jgi:hypothetical protein
MTATTLSSAWSLQPQIVNEERIDGIIDVRCTERRIECEALFLAEDDFSFPKAPEVCI